MMGPTLQVLAWGKTFKVIRIFHNFWLKHAAKIVFGQTLKVDCAGRKQKGARPKKSHNSHHFK